MVVVFFPAILVYQNEFVYNRIVPILTLDFKYTCIQKLYGRCLLMNDNILGLKLKTCFVRFVNMKHHF